MANRLQIKRSATAAKIPLTTDLLLGELALNTTDGRMFSKKNVASVDSIIEFLTTDNAFKVNVAAATTANITLSGAQTIDGVAVVAGDRVLVKDQTTASQNGVYIAAAGAWARSAGMDVAGDCAGAIVIARAGTVNGGRSFDTDFKATDTVGTTAMSWFRVLDAGSIGSDVQAFSSVLGSVAGQSAGTGLLKLTAGVASLDTGTYLTSAVTTINFGTTGLTPATATSGAVTVAGTLAAANGGTGQSSYAVGDLLYASTTTALSKLADVATGNALISGGVGVAPAWGKIGLTTHVSGTLPVGNGGTGATTLTGVLKGNGTSAFTAATAGTDYMQPGTTSNLTKGFTFTANPIGSIASGGSVAPNPANGNYQWLTNASAGSNMTISAPTSDCAIDILVVNGATSVGSISMSGFKTPGTGVSGATYAVTANTWWILSIRRVNSVSTFIWNGPWT